MLAHGVKSHKIEIPKDLVKSVRLARQRYNDQLEAERKRQEVSEKDVQKAHILDDLAKVQDRKTTLEKTINQFMNEILELVDVVENPSVAIKLKTLKRSITEMSGEIKKLEDVVEGLEEKKRKLT